MAEYKSKIIKSKSGHEVIIRSANIKDAAGVFKLAKSVIDEEIFQLTSASEFNFTIEMEEKWIESHLNNPNHIILVAEVNSEIVGLLDFANGSRQRISHTGEFGLSVHSNFRDQGIGSMLLQTLIEWAAQNNTIEKIGLNVHCNNDRAIALYKKFGFEVEGVRKRDLKYGNAQYVDTVVMGKFV